MNRRPECANMFLPLEYLEKFFGGGGGRFGKKYVFKNNCIPEIGENGCNIAKYIHDKLM